MTEPEAPAHDPLADEMDLLTLQEAAARLHENLVAARADLESAGVSSPRADVLRCRVETLEDGVRRYAGMAGRAFPVRGVAAGG
ncbi:MAG TPA: hypothetical protein VK402_16410 [Blastococcus sp.]|nr:hypothetical protein [Blastococcus sp.]